MSQNCEALNRGSGNAYLQTVDSTRKIVVQKFVTEVFGNPVSDRLNKSLLDR